MSKNKIDAAVTAVLAFGARQEYLKSKRNRRGWLFSMVTVAEVIDEAQEALSECLKIFVKIARVLRGVRSRYSQDRILTESIFRPL